MKHYVFLKFKPEQDLDEAEKIIRSTFRGLDNALPWFMNPCVYRNTIDRDTNADILATVEIESEEQLTTYLAHPLHRAMAARLDPEVERRTTFDHK
ncbi:MAG: Dabb family protein [Mobilibacterium timonense]|uniref:Dabb family protein n=1 Tax=Mobilibacterium timonense TaxID=1871012 RepID=UPI0009858F1C|nr:Dabb family protein [Mobilibacterium timonense]MBM6991478.1 Dabb family protein [Mobilibacterium timonense]